MNLFYIVGFIISIIGISIIFDLNMVEISNRIFFHILKEPSGIKSKMMINKGIKKKKWLQKQIDEVKDILAITERNDYFGIICSLAIAGAIVGVIVAGFFGNPFLMPVLLITGFLAPFLYIKITQVKVNRNITSELETALSCVTSTYLRTENIITAIDENIIYINSPIKKVFSDFLNQVNNANIDVSRSIKNMKKNLNNEIYKEWCDALILCINDRSMKKILMPIVDKLTETSLVNSELDTIIESPRSGFFTLVLMVWGNYPVIRIISKTGYNYLTATIFGQVLTAALLVITLYCFVKVVDVTKPIEYRK